MTAFRGRPSERHERLLAMRAQRRLIADADVQAAIEEVDTSGLVALLEQFVSTCPAAGAAPCTSEAS
ncbi:hypothetical protein [Streptomyces diastatochromogenes]|uniref:hypothetical protein n=1 Tax=Streptomyces diastatochromogenes TaxID=42236 RepID=UPI001FC9F87C|nr:hypothetical protein [Streptomyces diastatochromogenes]MCZ0984750.1 hypothetical protein [Streptomyces diastatochromogenes]